MRHRSRSRNYDSDNYKSRRSPIKYESSRTHKSKVTHSHYSSESRKHESSKLKKISEKSHYDVHKDSDSDDKYFKKIESHYSRECRKSKYNRGDSPTVKNSRKYDTYTHSYRRKSISSDTSHHTYEDKYKKIEEKSDKRAYKSNREQKRKVSRSVSSDQFSDLKNKIERVKEKTKDKKLKKKTKKSEKDKEKKKRKRQRHSSSDDVKINNKRHGEDKRSPTKVTIVANETEDNKEKIKLEPFKLKESSNLKSQINFLNSSNIFTKDEWQKESSDDDSHRKIEKDGIFDKEINPNVEIIEIIKESNIKVLKTEDGKDFDRERMKKKRHKSPLSKSRESNTKISKHIYVEEDKLHLKFSECSRKERSYSHNKSSETLKLIDSKEKIKPKDHRTSMKNIEDRKRVEDLFEDERIELPRTPTDAQYTGLFARLQEEPVSDTEIESILPPILLDDRMKALLVNDPNVIHETWDSEDDVLLNKRENIIAPKHRGVLETLSVPWSTLIEEASLNKNKHDKDSGLIKFNVSKLLDNIGISKQLSGDLLWDDIKKHCVDGFLHPMAPVHQTLLSQKIRRNSIFCERGLFAGALSARKDLFIRRVLYEKII